MNSDIKRYEAFINDIGNFIKNHEYLKQEDTEAEITNHGELITIPTVDGAFESVIIKIIPTA